MFKKTIIFSLAVILIAATLNMPVKSKQGVNYELKTFKIPFYIKIIGYLYRDYWYRGFANEIGEDYTTDGEKVIAIFNWVTENIHNVPEGFDIVDDHTYNIIVRRYGTPDQMADVFATLCVYSGFSAFCGFDIEYAKKEGKKYHGLSYVLLDDKWRVFDFYHNTYFLNENNEIATQKDLRPINKDFVSKAEKQAPLLRLKYETRQLIQKLAAFKK